MKSAINCYLFLLKRYGIHSGHGGFFRVGKCREYVLRRADIRYIFIVSILLENLS
jgi:hypothetical protein